MATEEQLDQQVTLAMVFLIGVATPKYHLPPVVIDALKTRLPSLQAWAYAASIWDSVADLQGSVDRFKSQVYTLDHHNRKFPCVIGIQEQPIPIDPIAIPGFDTDLFGPEFATEIEIPKINIERLSIEDFPLEQATEFFLSGLDSFLRTRLSAPRSRHRYIFQGGSPGLLFQVTTNTNGYTVHYTHQYYLNPNYIFGAPTTPVNAFIQPGRWHFGTSKGNGPITWDLSNVYDVPQMFQAHIPV